jgi:putative ABC transport system permease protein
LDLFRNTIRSLRAHKLRYALTSLGILWGALMLTLLSSSMAGVSQHFKDELEEIGPKVVKLWPGYVIGQHAAARGARAIEIDGDDLARIAALDSIEDIAPDTVLWSQIVRAGRRTKLLAINGVTEKTQRIRAFEVARGRFITPTDVERGALVAFLGTQAATRLFGHTHVIGETIQIESVAFRVVGVSVGKGDQLVGVSGSDDHAVMIPSTTLGRYFAHDDKVRQFVFAPVTRERSFAAVRQTKQLLALHHDFDPDVATAVNVINLYEVLKGIYLMMGAIQIFQLFAGIITLFVGAVGVMNIMLVVVGERRGEIGLRRAVGATTREIFVQFMAEAIAVSVLAGIVGAALGIAAAQLIAQNAPPGAPGSSPPVFDPLTMIAVVTSLTVVAIVSGVAPAIRAARVPPAEALRAAV